MLNETVRHYDLDVEFFREFLDPYMKYTSGLYVTDQDDLFCACQRMLDKIIEFGKILPGSRVLEIGPGWGSLLRRMHERDLICEYVGVSPSSKQNNFIRDFSRDNEYLVTSTFEQFYSGKKYDAIILVGSFCHLKNKSQQLKKMHSMLACDGRIVIEDTFFTSQAAYDCHRNNEATRFLQNDVFGFAEILPLSSQVEQFASAGLKIKNSIEHSSSYRNTIASWLRKLKTLDTARYPRVKEFITYLHVAQRGWNYTTQNHLIVLTALRSTT